ncbi:uncharacterized protein DUF5080 [Staphylococcus hominis]|uniref:DUF5080 family protein n=2 Tax=Staphylococcus hominis TaxID=1290 RepID=UPI001F59BAA3|nr:DUF5080 family protein [Staphylococcus hominis]MCI2870256.1 DUF5080 family protein [Staphylococcus hominis]MCI2872059.1 DUF5080 family protein [Staphylococcus hominis]MCI2876330.1 DUF5080 family protein [Staphylococcus hominis]MDS3838243.1 DUF5080 family protein [Staphylococcus hominis]MDS3894771.1 DUF5080 family protein [Staphylococcus hominis]
MDILLVIIVFGLFYLVYFTSVMHSGGLKVLPTITYIIALILYLIPVILIKEESSNQFENLMLILNIGVLLYGIMGVRGLWSRPLKVKIQELTKSSDKMITQHKYDNIESMKINLEIAKYKGIISLLISFIFMITMSIKASSQYKEDFVFGNIIILYIFIAIFVIYTIIDIIFRMTKGRWKLISIRPLLMAIWLFIFIVILLIQR